MQQNALQMHLSLNSSVNHLSLSPPYSLPPYPKCRPVILCLYTIRFPHTFHVSGFFKMVLLMIYIAYGMCGKYAAMHNLLYMQHLSGQRQRMETTAP